MNLNILTHAHEQAMPSSKHVLLRKTLRHNGRPDGPEGSDWSEVASLYPTTFAVEVCNPYLIIRLQSALPYPWPLTIEGLPVWCTASETAMPMDRGTPGLGKPIMNKLHLREIANMEYATLKDVINRLINHLSTAVLDVYWWAGFWTVTVGDDAQFKNLPWRIGNQPAYYKRQMDSSQGKPSALHQKTTSMIGVVYNNKHDDLGEHASLRPGIMLATPPWKLQATNDQGHFSTTSNGFLKLLQGDLVSMDGPFSGRADGQVVATGAQVMDVPGRFTGHDG